MYSLLGFVVFTKEFLPSPYSDYHFWQFLPDWSTPTWLALLLFILICGVLEAAYTQQQLSNNHRESKLIGVEKWTNERKPLKPSAIISGLICVAVIAFAWSQSTRSSGIHIRNVEIGWLESDRVFIGRTDKAPPDKTWVANVRYISSITHHDVRTVYMASTLEIRSNDVNARSDAEDVAWDDLMSLLKHDHGKREGFQVLANTPLFISLVGWPLSQQDLDDISSYKKALYFTAVFADQNSSRVIAEVCVYREGSSPTAHYCHDHNGSE